MYKPLDETKCSFIETLEDLVALNEKLCKLSEFAVDLEVRDKKKFMGVEGVGTISIIPMLCHLIQHNR